VIVDDVAIAPTLPALVEAPVRYRFQPPRLKDPRLHVAAVVVTVQVLGQVVIGFDLSIAQILVAVGTAGLIEVMLSTKGDKVIAWPASALLSGNGVALLLRVPGTEHGDWFSMRGWYVFAATAALAVLSKYVLRVGGRPLFNPSNLALVVAFLVLGSGLADPQDLWWGPMSPGLALTYGVIIVGGVVITRRLGLLAVSAAFWVVFGSLMAGLALAGHSMTARWSLTPVSGAQYWYSVVLSPEILIFVFFMITDPRTAARGRSGGVIYAALVAATSAVLVAFQSTEYATKVALLSGLVVVCAVRPLIERVAPAGHDESVVRWARANTRRGAGLAAAAVTTIALVVAGSWWSATDASAGSAERAAGGSMTVELSDAQRPAVVFGGGLASLGTPLDDGAARQLVLDVVEDVLVADLAIEESDAELAASVATGPFLAELTGRPAIPAPERTFDSALLDVVRDSDNFQAVPRLSIEFTGTADGEAWTTTYHVSVTGEGSLIEREVPAR